MPQSAVEGPQQLWLDRSEEAQPYVSRRHTHTLTSTVGGENHVGLNRFPSCPPLTGLVVLLLLQEGKQSVSHYFLGPLGCVLSDAGFTSLLLTLPGSDINILMTPSFYSVTLFVRPWLCFCPLNLSLCLSLTSALCIISLSTYITVLSVYPSALNLSALGMLPCG